MSETHWKKLTNPNYLGSWDFQKSEERTLTIKHIVQEEVFNPSDNSKKSCIVAHFTENSKPMVLNKTNCKMIQTLYKTPTIEKWSGCRVIILVEKVKAFGKIEEALRIKNQLPAKSQQPTTIVEPEIPCNDCGKAISGFEGYTAKQVANANNKRYGRDICAECSSKLKANESEGNEEK